MWVFIWSGLLYLIGVAVILIWRPSLMFDDEGQWKEFRIGGDRSKYTWMPVWLALLLWALICYILVSIIHKLSTPGKPSNNRKMRAADIESGDAYDGADGDEYADNDIEEVVKIRKRRGKRVALPPGYYILDRQANNRTGTPHYVYIGEAPDSGAKAPVVGTAGADSD
jgi:hypothetical protein